MKNYVEMKFRLRLSRLGRFEVKYCNRKYARGMKFMCNLVQVGVIK